MVLGSQFGARIVDLGRWGMRRMTPWDVVFAGGEGGHNASADAALAVLSPQTFSFTLDDDLVKVVTVWSDGQSCHVNIRYGHDVVLQEENHAFEIASPISIEPTRYGVTIRTRRRWPLQSWKLVRKF